MGLTNISTDWRDLVRKAMPIGKRGATWLDWNHAAIAPIRSLNADYQLFAESLIFNNRHSAQAKSLNEFLNDLFDPNLRGVSIITNNDNTDYNSFTISWPDYLVYGEYQAIVTRALERFLYLGVSFNFNVYVSGLTPDFVTYLDHIEAGLVGSEVLTDDEIWGVIYVWNQFYGAGILSDFGMLHLMSLTSELNAKVDFINPLGADLTEIPNGGAIDWSFKGFASDGLAVLGTGYTHSTKTTDIKNACTFLYITEDAGEFAGSECGVIDTLEVDIINIMETSVAGQAIKGRIADVIAFNNSSAKGAYCYYADTGLSNIIKGQTILATNVVMDAASAKPAIDKYLCGTNLNGVVSETSKNRIGSHAEVDAKLTPIYRLFVNAVLTEYNRRVGRL